MLSEIKKLKYVNWLLHVTNKHNANLDMDDSETPLLKRNTKAAKNGATSTSNNGTLETDEHLSNGHSSKDYGTASKNFLPPVVLINPSTEIDEVNDPLPLVTITKTAKKFIAYGNVLLDHSVKMSDDKVLKQFELDANELKETGPEQLDDILKTAQDRFNNIDIHPGGSALNTCRMLAELGSMGVMFFGSIGNDDNGRLIKSDMTKHKINACLQVSPSQPTGKCVCLIHEHNRCCIANIGASSRFELPFLTNVCGEGTALHRLCHRLKSGVPRIFYVEGFFVPNHMAVCHYIYNAYCGNTEGRNVFATNLSAEYIIRSHTRSINYLAKKSDILIGNEREFDVLAEVNGFKSRSHVVHALCKARTSGMQKIILITNGEHYVDVVVKDGDKSNSRHHREYVLPILKQDIKDTTGAGDAFVAGFFYDHMDGGSVYEAVRFGMRTAALKIREIGGTLKK